jgi:L-lactate dehydrogenase complex protein LldG
LPADLAAEFSRQLTAVGGHAYSAQNEAEASQQLGNIIENLRQQGLILEKAVITTHPILAEIELDSLLAHLELESFIPPHTAYRMQDADVGITGAEFALASSGTLVMAASPQHPRSVSLLPPIHLAVIKQSQLLPDLAALAEKIREDGKRPSSGLALITGPSRTGDIEQTLSIGVHGPGELHVLMIDD